MNQSGAGIDALLFDLGGVLIDVDFERVFASWSLQSGVPVAIIRSRFSADGFYEQHERGEIDGAAYFASLRNSLGINLSDRHFEEGWNAIFSAEIPGMIQLMAKLKALRPLYLFSNTNPIHQHYWANRFDSMLSLFQRVFVSSEIGLRKPEQRAFAHVAQQIGVPPKRILFFDDMAENVEAARNAGMQAVHITSVAGVEAAIEHYFPAGASSRHPAQTLSS